MCTMPKKISLMLAVLFALAGCARDHESRQEKPAGFFSTSPNGERSASTGRKAGRTFATKLFDEESGSARPKLEKVEELGSGRLIGQPAPLGEDALARDDGGDITLNMVDADIREVVRLILQDGLNANYVIDPAVNGSATIRTSRPVPADEILPLLSSVLQANGAALIEQEGLFRVVPAGNGGTSPGRPSTRLSLQAGRGGGILAAPLRHVDGVRLAELLQPFVAKNGAVQLDAARNTLLITGSPDQIQTMNELIDMFDVDWMAGMSFGFYPLEIARAGDLALELEQLFGADGEEQPASGAFRLIPIERLNALVVMATEPSYLRRAERWIERLDRIGDGDEEQIFVYAVQNGRAADLASVLGELFDIRSTAIGSDPLLAPGLEPIELGTSLLEDASATTEDGERGQADRSFTSDGVQPFGQRELTQGADDSGTRIVADESNNALLIKALPKEYKKIEAALAELDRAPLQVLLEATIAEVTLRDELSYGIQWFFNAGKADFTLSERSTGSVDPFFPGFAGLLSSSDVRVVIDALDSVSDVQVISSPQILVLDNQTARLEVGDEVPIVTRQSEGLDTNDARIVNTVEQRQTGVILNVTPRVNASGQVVLDIQQEVSDVVQTTTSGIDSPTIAQRRVGTTVSVGSHQTVALGGLIQDDTDRIRTGLPILSALPVIGTLFGSTTNRNERTELLILITPRILADSQAAVAATDELRRRLRAVAPLQERITDPYGASEPTATQPRRVWRRPPRRRTVRPAASWYSSPRRRPRWRPLPTARPPGGAMPRRSAIMRIT